VVHDAGLSLTAGFDGNTRTLIVSTMPGNCRDAGLAPAVGLVLDSSTKMVRSFLAVWPFFPMICGKAQVGAFIVLIYQL
jgi:hypothetical protein